VSNLRRTPSGRWRSSCRREFGEDQVGSPY
jgi:hypothetical protein